MIKIFSVICMLFLPTLASYAAEDPQVVNNLDIERYQGLWYEIAHSPNNFQKDCQRSTAVYGIVQDDALSVLNTCYANNKEIGSITGIARIPNLSEPAKLVVDFGFNRTGDYWIVKLGSNYQWAVVSGPAKKSIFILARVAPMNPTELQGILDDMRGEGYDVDNLIYDEY